jgi:putative transposase
MASSPRLTNYATTYSPSLLSSSLATTEGGPQQVESDGGEPPKKKARTKKKENLKPSAGKAKRIRVYPNATQKTLLNGWFGTARWTYNQCLQKIKEDRTNLKKATLRTLVVNNTCHDEKETQWVLGTPYMVRDGAMIELVNAYTSNFAKKKKKDTSHQFSLKFRSKKDAQESIYVEGRNFKKGVFYPSFFGKTPLESAEPLPDKVDYDCRLTRNRLGHYHICIPQPLDMKSDNQAQRVLGRVAALDPGVRTFHTVYDATGHVLEVGKNDIGRIYRLCYYLDNLESRITLATGKKQKYRMRKAAMRMRLRIRNLIDECHKKLATFLLSEYEVILLPSFEAKDMVSRRKRVLSSKSARAMLTWSHYRFKQRLLFKRQEYPWCKVLVVDEAFTTKTCGHCGKLHPTLTSAKIFQCPSCGVVLDRDANAARNILLKNSSLFGFAVEEALGLTPSSTL